jgi:hypothetical protein
MELFQKKYENVEFTYYEPNGGQLYYQVSTRLKHITNGDFSQYMADPANKQVKKLGKTMVTVSARVIDESFTKVESDIKMLNFIWSNVDHKTFTNTKSIPAAIARLKNVGINVEQHNAQVKTAEECIYDLG